MSGSFFKNIIAFLDRWKNWIIGSVLLFLLIVFVAFTENKTRKEICKAVKVNLTYEGKDIFLTEDEILQIINKTANGSVMYKNLRDIDLLELESELNQNNFVRKTDLYFDLKGVLYADVNLRSPVIRVINTDNSSYYIDKDAKRMSVSSIHTTKILVATGYINNANPILKVDRQLFELADYINKDPFLKCLIGQIYVKKDVELLLIPKIGDLVIDFGTPADMETKFEKLKIFYKKILPFEGWNKYSKVTLKFKNQIIVNKR